MGLGKLTSRYVFESKIDNAYRDNEFTTKEIDEFFRTANYTDEDPETLNEAELEEAMQTVHTKYEVIKNLQKPSLELVNDETMTEDAIYKNIRSIDKSINEKKAILLEFFDKDTTSELEYSRYQAWQAIGSQTEMLDSFMGDFSQFCNENPVIGDRVKASGAFDLLDSIKTLTNERDEWYNKLSND